MSKRTMVDEEEEGEGDEADEDDAVPVVTLTIINVHPSHFPDARLYLQPEIDIAEAAGARIVIKVIIIIIIIIPLIQSSQTARPTTHVDLRRPTSATQDSYTSKLGLGCHAGQPMVLDQRWAAALSLIHISEPTRPY